MTVSFADLTTIHVGGEISHFIEPRSRADFILALIEADTSGLPLCVIGGGSNMLVSDEPFDGVVVRDARREISVLDEAAPVEITEEGEAPVVHVGADAGANWDDFVSYTVRLGLEGVEALSGIPGTVGASVVQNIGAYGQEVATAVEDVEVWDREEKKVIHLNPADMKFGYRTSLLKQTMYRDGNHTKYFPTPRYVVLYVTFALHHSSMGKVAIGQLAKALNVKVGEHMATAEIRRAVLEIRSRKGMLEDPARYANSAMAHMKTSQDEAIPTTNQDDAHNRWSCGSFFINPVVSKAIADSLPADAPCFATQLPDGSEGVKTSAAWLIDHAGFHPGFSMGDNAALSSVHTLALTNRGNATSTEIVKLARHIQAGVEETFGIQLVPEPVFIGL